MLHSIFKIPLYLFLLITCLVCAPAISSPLALPLTNEMVNLKPHIQMYTGNEYPTINALIASQAEFSEFSVKSPSPGDAEHWLKIELLNASKIKRKWYLKIGHPSMPLMQAYWRKGDNTQVISLLDGDSSFEDRAVDEPLLFIPLELSAGEVKTFYLHYRAVGDFPVSLRVFTEKSFHEYQLVTNSINYAVLGFMLAIFFLSMIFLVANHNVLYFYFCCLILFMSLLIADMAGYNHKFLWPKSGMLADKLIEYIVIATHLSYLFFIREIMQLKALNVPLYRVFSGLIIAGILLLISAVFFSVIKFLFIIGLLSAAVYIYASVWAVRNRLVSARIYALSIFSHILFVFGLFLFSMLVFNPFPAIYFMYYATIGYVLEAVFFTITLSHRSYITNRGFHESLLLRIEEANDLVRAEQKNNLLLKEKQEQLLKFTGTVHDVFQPLSSVRMAVGVIPDGTGRDLKKYIDNTVEYAESLLKSFMLDSKSDFNNSNTHFMLGELFESVISRHKMSADKKNIRLHFFNSFKVCSASQDILVRVLDNLIANAIRYTKSGGVLMGVRHKAIGVEIQVIDTGIGMSLGQVDKLLEPFVQNSGGEVGYGIGLYVVKNLCEESGFKLSISSVKNKGTCVKVLIPN